MLLYIKYLLFCYGATAIFMYSALMEPIRNLITIAPLKKMTECAMCLGFWVGFFTSLYVYSDVTIRWFYGVVPFPVFPSGFMSVGESIVNGIASSGVTWLLCAVTLSALWTKADIEEAFFEKNKECETTTIKGFNRDKEEVELHG